MSFREQFDSAQWRTLQFAPFLILSGVAGRYRDFAGEEMAAFERWLDEAARAPGSLNREVLSSVAADVTGIGGVRELRRHDRRWAHGRWRRSRRPAGAGDRWLPRRIDPRLGSGYCASSWPVRQGVDDRVRADARDARGVPAARRHLRRVARPPPVFRSSPTAICRTGVTASRYPSTHRQRGSRG
jgi:hypothetical protein